MKCYSKQSMVVNKTIKTTKRNDIMAFIELEDLYGNIEVVVFPQVLQRYNHILNEDNIVYVKGRLNIKEDEPAKIIANEFRDINDNLNSKSRDGLYIKIDTFSNNILLNKIKSILGSYPGNESVYLFADDSRKLYKFSEYNININQQILKDLESILPKENIKIKSK